MTKPDKNGWLPIESAPKDGTQVLAWVERDPRRIGIRKFVYALIVYRDGEWVTMPGGWVCYPTKFQYLPTPPESENE